MQDQRQYLRFDSFLVAQASGDKSTSAGSARLINISRQGVAVEMNTPLPCAEHSVLKVKTYLPGEDLPIIFEGKVIWALQKGAQCIAGLALQNMEPGNKSDLLDYAYQGWHARKLAY